MTFVSSRSNIDWPRIVPVATLTILETSDWKIKENIFLGVFMNCIVCIVIMLLLIFRIQVTVWAYSRLVESDEQTYHYFSVISSRGFANSARRDPEILLGVNGTLYIMFVS